MQNQRNLHFRAASGKRRGREPAANPGGRRRPPTSPAPCDGDLIRLQGNGDYAGAVAFFEKYAHLDDEARSLLPLFKDIPVDIAPVYPDRV